MAMISVTRALVELKRLDERISKAVTGGVFISRTIGRGTSQKVVGSSDSVADMTQKIQGSFDKVTSLILNRERMKSAIVMSNAATKVTILGREISVAEAIELKSTVSVRTLYLNTLRAQMLSELNMVSKATALLEAEIETSVNTLYGADSKKLDPETLKNVSEVKKTQKEQALLDSGKIADKIEAIEADILNLTSELDFVLSESNAKTVISVEV